MSDVVIKVENLSKQYRLGVLGHGSLSHEWQSYWAKFLGKEDPNTILDLGKKVSKNEEFWALKDISFQVKQGEILGIIGRNGAGKSTLLKILSRVTAPTEGCIKVKGRIASLLEVGTGFHPELTGRENVYLNGAILGMSKKEIDSKFEEIVDFSEIEKFIDTPVKRYSSGMYVRLAFAVAAHLEPEILIVDEVLAVGDASFQKKCLGKMQDVSNAGRTVLIVSHQMNVVNRLCERAILLSNGQLVKDDLTSKVVKDYLGHNHEGINSKVLFQEDFNKDAQILEASIHFANGDVIDRQLNVTESFNIQIKLDLRKNNPDLCGAFYFRNSSGEQVLFSDMRDHNNSFHPFKQGLYELKTTIPAPLLVPEKYTVTFGLSDQRGLIDHLADVISFEIQDISGVRNKRRGYIYSPLEWSLNYAK